MGFYRGANIVTNGLVLALDAANTKSYPGSGTTWSDLSDSNITGSLINSPTFNTSNGGNFGFITDDYVIIPEKSALNTQTPSVEVWFKTNSLNQSGFWFEKGNVNTQYSLFQENTNIVWRQCTPFLQSQYTVTANYVNTNSWFQVVGTFISGDRRLYINGVLVNSDTQTGTIATNTNGASVGVYGGFNGGRGYFYNGSIATVRVYNKVLTTSEVLQNYNAQKARFGL